MLQAERKHQLTTESASKNKFISIILSFIKVILLKTIPHIWEFLGRVWWASLHWAEIVASCHHSSRVFTWSARGGPCSLLHPGTATMWAVKWPSSSSNSVKVPFQLLVWKHLRPGGEGTDREDHLNISSSAPLTLAPRPSFSLWIPP